MKLVIFNQNKIKIVSFNQFNIKIINFNQIIFKILNFSQIIIKRVRYNSNESLSPLITLSLSGSMAILYFFCFFLMFVALSSLINYIFTIKIT